jgi:TPP-dependent indolepyruvate ferredoxin oxidoreductase alpha subunit
MVEMRLVQPIEEEIPTEGQGFVLGNEAAASGVIHPGLTSTYGCPGAPSTEFIEYLIQHGRVHGIPSAECWSNEKTTYEAALEGSLVLTGEQ